MGEIPGCVPPVEQSGDTPSTLGHSLGDLLRDAPVIEPDLGFLHRLHGETLDICGSEGATGAHHGVRGQQGRGAAGSGGARPGAQRGTALGVLGEVLRDLWEGVIAQGTSHPPSPIAAPGGYTGPGSW